MGITGQRFEIVGGPDAGRTRLVDHSLHERSKFVRGDGVEAGGGLIEEQERRLKHQDTGERYTSLLAKTQRVTRSLEQVVNAKLLCHLYRSSVRLAVLETAVPQTPSDVFGDGAGDKVMLRILSQKGDAAVETVGERRIR